MSNFERWFRPSSMVDQEEWAGFRADIIVAVGIGVVVLFMLFLLERCESTDSMTESDCEVEQRGKPVICDGQVCGCTADSSNYR